MSELGLLCVENRQQQVEGVDFQKRPHLSQPCLVLKRLQYRGFKLGLPCRKTKIISTMPQPHCKFKFCLKYVYISDKHFKLQYFRTMDNK